MTMTPKYVLITPVRNEQDFIEETINTVLSQTVLPLRWMIVSDQSTDRTDEIVRRYESQFPFIRLLRIETSTGRDFCSKVRAFNLGYESITELSFDYLGNLDGDVTFAPRYYEHVLEEFERDPRLGIAGGIIMENIDGRFEKQMSSPHHTPGATQMFRRPCFEGIGGYLPLRNGGEDSAADIMSQMNGWETRSFSHLVVFHHRRVGSGLGGVLRSRYLAGVTDYNLGKHPVFMLFKGLRRLNESPYVLGSICRIVGFVAASLRRERRVVSHEFIRFIRRKQMRKIFSLQ